MMLFIFATVTLPSSQSIPEWLRVDAGTGTSCAAYLNPDKTVNVACLQAPKLNCTGTQTPFCCPGCGNQSAHVCSGPTCHCKLGYQGN